MSWGNQNQMIQSPLKHHQCRVTKLPSSYINQQSGHPLTHQEVHHSPGFVLRIFSGNWTEIQVVEWVIDICSISFSFYPECQTRAKHAEQITLTITSWVRNSELWSINCCQLWVLKPAGVLVIGRCCTVFNTCKDAFRSHTEFYFFWYPSSDTEAKYTWICNYLLLFLFE